MKNLFTLFGIISFVICNGQYRVPIILSVGNVTDAKSNQPNVLKASQTEDLLEQLNGAKNGNAKDMNAVGMRLYLGIDTSVDRWNAIQWYEESAQKGYAIALYNLGMIYKYGNPVPVDYIKAYTYFEKLASANEPIGWYAQGYMLYKGLGCNQDYTHAFQLFRKGAAAGNSGSMYFTGLCYRNGFGVKQNTDSATFWLTKAALKNYHFALDELASKGPENGGIANETLLSIKTANAINIDKYQKLPDAVPASDITGDFSGYLIKYDYSGQYIVQVTPLLLNVNYNTDSKQLQGQWIEGDHKPVGLNAVLTNQGLLFKDVKYEKTDHYSAKKAKPYNFEKASLQLITKNDSAFLFGNIQLFSVDSKEPEKPLMIVLVRNDNRSLTSTNPSFKTQPIISVENFIKSSDKLQVYPNPFSDQFTIEFTLPETCQVETQLLTIDGKIIYTKHAGTLDAGSYKLIIQRKLIAGTYVVKLIYGNKIKTATIVQQ